MTSLSPKVRPWPRRWQSFQALLTALIGDAPLDATLILANTYRGGKTDESSHAVATIPSLVLGGHSLEALAACHTGIEFAHRKSSQTRASPQNRGIAQSFGTGTSGRRRD
jgi:hypothetical protein